jgi:hypothetical protein
MKHFGGEITLCIIKDNLYLPPSDSLSRLFDTAFIPSSINLKYFPRESVFCILYSTEMSGLGLDPTVLHEYNPTIDLIGSV